MPLRDHFRPPVSKRASWEGFHGLWPGIIVRQLAEQLPDGYMAEPRVHLGSAFEIDVSTYESDSIPSFGPEAGNGGLAVATWAPPKPGLDVEVELDEQYAYEVLVYDTEHERTLVAAIEIVSPANKDRQDTRQTFIVKCASLLRSGVCVSILDLVSIKRFNLYLELLEMLDRTDPAFEDDPPAMYSATCVKRGTNGKTRLQTWAERLSVGNALPPLPIWLSDTLCIRLDLEKSYEETCRVLRLV